MKLEQPINRDQWYVFRLFGKAAYADSGLCLVGAPPSDNAAALPETNAAKMEKAIAKRDAPMSLKSKDQEHVYFNELELPVDARYYDHVLEEYPAAVFHLPKSGDATKPITIKSDGQIVGALMCMAVY